MHAWRASVAWVSGLPPLQEARAAAETAAAAAAAAETASTAGQNKAFERAVHAGVGRELICTGICPGAGA